MSDALPTEPPCHTMAQEESGVQQAYMLIGVTEQLGILYLSYQPLSVIAWSA